jgi:hypothetical protein
VKRGNLDINLYTHNLFVNGLGSSSLRILTAWRFGALTRPTVNLFPQKMSTGFMGHQFVVSAGHQPPFVVKRQVSCSLVTVDYCLLVSLKTRKYLVDLLQLIIVY